MTDELAKTIERLELWADYWTPHQPPEFIADLRTLIGTAKAAVRAAELLQAAQRYDLAHYNTGAVMEYCTHGDYVDISDVKTVIQILQEGQT